MLLTPVTFIRKLQLRFYKYCTTVVIRKCIFELTGTPILLQNSQKGDQNIISGLSRFHSIQLCAEKNVRGKKLHRVNKIIWMMSYHNMSDISPVLEVFTPDQRASLLWVLHHSLAAGSCSYSLSEVRLRTPKGAVWRRRLTAECSSLPCLCSALSW